MKVEEAEKLLDGQVFLGRIYGYAPVYKLRFVSLSQNKKCVNVENVTIGGYEWRPVDEVTFLDVD